MAAIERLNQDMSYNLRPPGYLLDPGPEPSVIWQAVHPSFPESHPQSIRRPDAILYIRFPKKNAARQTITITMIFPAKMVSSNSRSLLQLNTNNTAASVLSSLFIKCRVELGIAYLEQSGLISCH